LLNFNALNFVFYYKIMADNQVLYLSRNDIEDIGLRMREIIDVIDRMFVEKGQGDIEMPPKPGIHTRGDSFIHAMAAYIPGMEVAGMKWVSGYPGNQNLGLPYISGLLILNDPDTGIPMAIMDAAWITAKRTGAATAVAAKYLARKDSTSVGIIACGVQGKSNLEALACQYKITRVKAYDLHREVAHKYAREMSELVQVDIEVVSHPKEAVVGMDIIITSGPILKQPSPVIEPDWLKEGSFASPVDFDSYWTGAAIRQVDKLATDDLGQLQYYRKMGYFKDTPLPYADLGEIAGGKKVGRVDDHERTMSINLGIAPDDMATALLIYKKALAQEIGLWLDL
jgi:ornithine cyclodeaminase/alanine dehydrogenase-like protein (mu-crystallin family)